nr:hypothetical protein [Tanacetum cinerariifolium]
LPPVVSPTTESSGYVAESDPEEDPEEYEEDEAKDGPFNYPMDGGDDGDDEGDGDSSGYDADIEDEDEEEEEEEHLAPADSAVVISIDELDPEEYEEDEAKDGPVDYPMDGGDDRDDDDDGHSSWYDADDEDEDNEDEEEEEEHLASADSAVVIPIDELASSAVTYTFVYIDSEPGRVFWGADKKLSDGCSPRVIVYGYDGLPMMPVAPPSPDYILGPEEPHTPPAPQDEDEHELVFIQPHDPDFMLEPIYLEYIPLEDEHILPAEEQPLPPVVLPTTE